MASVLTHLVRAWDQTLDNGRLAPVLLESLEMDGMAMIVRAAAVDDTPQAGPRALAAAMILGMSPGAGA